MEPTEIVSRLRSGPLDPQLAQAAAGALTTFLEKTALFQVEVDLSTNVARRGDKTAALSPSMAVLAHTLVQKHPADVPARRLSAALWGAAPKSPDTLRALLASTRDRLAPLGIRVANERGKGYRLVIGGDEC